MIRVLVSGMVFLSGLASAQSDGGLARGWYASGSTSSYEVTSLERGACSTKAIRATARGADPQGPVGVLQTFRADDFRGKRVRYSATLATEGVTGWTGLFFRADSTSRKTLSFDDMRARPLRGTRGCTRLTVIANVPPEAALLTLGFGLQGPGAVELSDLSLELVSTDVPLTTGLDQTHGRVGNVWFTDQLVTISNGGRLAGRLPFRSPGVWADQAGDNTAQVDGERVVATLFLPRASHTALMLTGTFTIHHEAGTTVITGDWGTTVRRYPVTISLTATRLDMQWGDLERHLQVEPAPQLQEGCRLYARKSGPTTYEDGLEVCGGALSPTPPPIQTVMSFLMGGFRRFGRPLPTPEKAQVPPL